MKDLVHQKKKIKFSKAKTNFCLNLQQNGVSSYLFANGKEIDKLKANSGSVDFPPQFCLGSISGKFSYTEAEEVIFSIDYGNIMIDDILDINKYLMKKNDIV